MREDVDTSAGTPIADNGLHRPAATPSDSSSDASPERYSDDEDPSSSHPSHGEKIESDPAFAEAVKVAANFKANPHAAVGALLHDVPGSTPALIVAACEAARSKGKGWGWIRRRVENQVKEGADITPSKPAEEEGVWLPGETSRIDGDSLVRRVERIAEKHGITPREYILRCAVHLGPDRIAELRRTWPADRIANVVADPECYHPDDRRAEPSEAEKAAAVARMGKLLETVHGKTLGPGIFAEADVEAERRRQMAALDEWRRKRAATPPEPSPPIAPSISIAPPTAILAAQGAAS